MDLNIEEVNIFDIVVLYGKTKYANRNLRRYGIQFLVMDKKGECLLLESISVLKNKKSFTRWVNIYYDEYFSVIGRFILEKNGKKE